MSNRGYGGLFGAFPYAFRASDSWFFRSYVLLSALTSLLVGLLVAAGVVVLLGNTASFSGGSITLSRAFYIVVGLLVVGPILAPTLFVARRHRRGWSSDGDGYDVALALSGYAFLASLYVGLVVSIPPEFQQGDAGGVVQLLYALPPLAGLVPPLAAAGGIYLVHRVLR
ncbi:hypothetical protein ACFO0N_03100 [Halobium salinum]|uniref:DUF8056 domain-containing protein n=1 Tax=Halobium salinum TaxID=1364940 RepID=A0ABD5P7R6_9EURY|nr:hypothetical protein [Halobium salinum]